MLHRRSETAEYFIRINLMLAECLVNEQRHGCLTQLKDLTFTFTFTLTKISIEMCFLNDFIGHSDKIILLFQ